jgi:phage terminase small subunit
MLTAQKKRFADALMNGKNQRESAIEAGYSEKTAKIKGSQLAKDKDVRDFIERKKRREEQPVIEDCNSPKLVKDKNFEDPIETMKFIMNYYIHEDPKLSLEAAAKLAPYLCQKVGESGKKEAKNSAAKKAASKFVSLAPPKLVINNKG